MMWGPTAIFICFAAGCMEFAFTPGNAPIYQESKAVCESHWREWAQGEQAKVGAALREKVGDPKAIIVECKDYEDKGPLT